MDVKYISIEEAEAIANPYYEGLKSIYPYDNKAEKLREKIVYGLTGTAPDDYIPFICEHDLEQAEAGAKNNNLTINEDYINQIRDIASNDRAYDFQSSFTCNNDQIVDSYEVGDEIKDDFNSDESLVDDKNNQENEEPTDDNQNNDIEESKPKVSEDLESKSYNDSKISYNYDNVASSKTCIQALSDALDEKIERVNELDKELDNIDSPYNKLLPKIRFASLYNKYNLECNNAYNLCLQHLDAIVEAVRNFSSGSPNWSNKNLLDFYYNYKKGDILPGLHTAGSGGGGGGNDIPYEHLDNEIIIDKDKEVNKDENIGLENITVPDIPNLNDDSDLSNNKNDQYFIPNIMSNNDEKIEANEENDINESIDENDSIFKDIDDSVSTSIIPNIYKAKIEKTKKGGATTVAALAMAGIAGVGGKFLFDSNLITDDKNLILDSSKDDIEDEIVNENDNEKEVKEKDGKINDENVEIENNNSNNNHFDHLNFNSIEFKKNILSESEDDYNG